LAKILSVKRRGPYLIVEEEDPPADEDTARTLVEALPTMEAEGLKLRFVRTKGLRGILLIGERASPHLTDSNPLYPGRPLLEVRPLEGKEDGDTLRTCRVLNAYLREAFFRLSSHPLNLERLRLGLLPLNALATQRPGRRRDLQPFPQRWGLRALSISSGPLYWGLAEVLGMDCLKVGDTGDPAEDLKERLRLAVEASEYDFVHVHTKVPDEVSHTKDPWRKREAIEALDKAFEAVEDLEDLLLVVTSDHSTPSSGLMIHSGEPVPLLMVGRGVRRDGVERFDEVHCARGGLGFLRGKELMYSVLDLMDRAKLWTLRDHPLDLPYYPGPGLPLTLEGTCEGNP